MRAQSRYREQRRTEFYVLLGATLLAVVVFFSGSLDLWSGRAFYHPDHSTDPWFEQNAPLWKFLYHAAPWMTGFLLLGSLTILVGATWNQALRRSRLSAVYVFLVIALGSGLLVNAVFKPYWGRPRPREVVQLGGKYEYRPFYSPAVGSPGKSFPCGHCSVAFSYGLFFWLFRRKKPLFAWSALGGSLILGGLMGVARMSAGGHFFSDVVFAGLIVYWVMFWVYHHLLRVPEREDGDLAAPGALGKVAAVVDSRRSVSVVTYAALGVVTVLTLLVASPFHKEFELPLKDSALHQAPAIAKLRIEIESANVDLRISPASDLAFRIEGYAKGFGFPGNKIRFSCQTESAAEVCRIRKEGFFSDYESSLSVTLNPKRVASVELKLENGEVFQDPQQTLPESYSILRGQ